MDAIEHAESHCYRYAISSPDYDGIRDYGILQIHGDEIFNPIQNIATAYSIWQRQGYQAWSSYNNQSYLLYLQ